jgi:hypothetical protein
VRGGPTIARGRLISWRWLSLAAGIGFVIGAGAMLAAWQAKGRGPTALAEATGPLQPAYEARLVSSKACLWDGNSLGSREIGSGLVSGDSVHLLEGLAEFELSWPASGSAKLSLEGPAAMILNSEGMPTLRFGRMTATISTSYRPFVLETPVGRLALAEYGSIGVSAYGNEGEIHVFDGTATLEPAWGTPEQQRVPLTIAAGEAIRILTSVDGEPNIARHSADAEYFATQVSMSSDSLGISKDYIEAVKKAGPIAYWRFNRNSWPQLPSEINQQLECLVNGSLGRVSYNNNEAVEFGVTDEGGEIVSNTPIPTGLISDSYAIEFWVKPSHYHVGAVVSLVGDAPNSSGVIPHGMLIELGGTGKIPTATHHPGCVRFLHRSPAGNETELGTSCYSTTAYTLRKWQHVVATKEASRMRLFVNGNVVAEGEDASALPEGLRLLVGRLYPDRRVRPFVGQFDELALYNRALSAEEIAEHYRLARPKTASKSQI